MSRYRWSKEAKERTGDPWVPCEDAAILDNLYWPGRPYFDQQLGAYITSTGQMRDIMRAKHLKQTDSSDDLRNPWRGLSESRPLGKKSFFT